MKESKTRQSNNTKFYLILYNTVEAVGWSLILFNLLIYLLNGDENVSLFDHVKWLVIIIPNSAILDILHAAIGLVPSNAVITAQLVYTRVFFVCGVILPTLAAKESIGFKIALFAWSVSDITRYSFYALNLLNSVPNFLLWLRSSLFIILFPIGFCGELLFLYAAQQEFSNTGRWSITFPNFFNLTFSYQYFLLFHIIALLSGSYFLYKHMFIQRRKALRGANPERKKN